MGIGTWTNPTVYLVDGRQVFISNNYPHLNYTIIKIKSDSINKKIKSLELDTKTNKTNIKNEKIKRNNCKKNVTFNDYPEIVDTYSKNEYDRSPIDSIIYLRTLQRINIKEWKIIFSELNKYKLQEMPVHKDSIQNIKIHNM